jgi:hypothetical protein
LFKFRRTDRSPTSRRIGYQLTYRTDRAKPKQLARANDLAKPMKTTADKPVVKPRDRRSRRIAEAPDRSSVWFQNRLVRQMSRPINNPSRKSPTDCNPSELIRK